MLEIVVITAVFLVFTIWREANVVVERQKLVERLAAKDHDIMDRLMAKSLPEVKQAQREQDPGIVTSKRRNDERMMSEGR